MNTSNRSSIDSLFGLGFCMLVAYGLLWPLRWLTRKTGINIQLWLLLAIIGYIIWMVVALNIHASTASVLTGPMNYDFTK